MKQKNNSSKWELVTSVPVFESKWMTIEKRTYRLPTGEVKEDYYHLKRPDYVLVLAIDDKNRILLERQYRRGVDEFVYELPAGWINEGEKPIDAAKRELEEETGAVGQGDQTVEVFPQPGFSSMKAHVAVLSVQSQGEHRREVDEHMTTEWVDLDKVKQMIKGGEIKDMGFLAAFSVFEAK